jgi:hypothetical protein
LLTAVVHAALEEYRHVEGSLLTAESWDHTRQEGLWVRDTTVEHDRHLVG